MWRVLLALVFLGGGINLAAAAEVEISNVWMKESIPGTENGAAYFTISNSSAAPVVLIGANTDAARATEVHQHVMRDGMMRMRRVPELVIEPNQTLVFQPGGYHLMLFGVKKAFKPGETVDFVLEFNDGDTATMTAVVKTIR